GAATRRCEKLLVDRLANERTDRASDRAAQGGPDGAEDEGRQGSVTPAPPVGAKQRPFGQSRSFDDTANPRVRMHEAAVGSHREVKLRLTGLQQHQITGA